MQHPPRIVAIGAGSAQFIGELADLCALADIGPYELAMVDTDPARLDVVAELGRRIAEETATPVTIIAEADRRAVMEGATAIVTSIGVGMQQSIQPDYEIPARHGLRQTVADTMGIGAIIRILRTAPVLEAIGRDAVELAPGAPLLNVTNPMTMCCMALRRLVPELTTVGLCHSVWETAATLSTLLDIPAGELVYEGAGVNHQVFLSRLVHDGVDVYPRLRELAASSGTAFAGTVRADLLRRLGYFPTESSKHNSEYVPWYLPHDSEVERYGLDVNPYWQRRANNAEWFNIAVDYADRRGNFNLHDHLPTGEYAPQIIRSMITGERREIYANLENRAPDGSRWVDELPGWAVVEIPASCDGEGVHGRPAPAIAPQCAALNRRYLDVCDLAVRAVVESDRSHVHHAAMLDPNCSATMTLDECHAMVDELLDAHLAAGRIPESLRS